MGCVAYVNSVSLSEPINGFLPYRMVFTISARDLVDGWKLTSNDNDIREIHPKPPIVTKYLCIFDAKMKNLRAWNKKFNCTFEMNRWFNKWIPLVTLLHERVHLLNVVRSRL